MDSRGPGNGIARSAERSNTLTWRTVVLVLIGPALVWLLGMVYLTAPEFSLKWIIQRGKTEYQVVELVTFGAALLAGIVLASHAARLWFKGGAAARPGAVVIGMIGAASVFFAMEEVSWGQTYLGWGTPEGYSEFSRETNLHNSEIPVQSLGSVFIIVMFFVLPIVWRFRERLDLPAGLAPGIAHAPSIACMASAFVWKEWKALFRLIHPEYENLRVYDEFFHNISEHKEMLVAVGLLLYAMERGRAVRLND